MSKHVKTTEQTESSHSNYSGLDKHRQDISTLGSVREVVSQARDRIKAALLLLTPHFDGPWDELAMTRGDVAALLAISEGADDLLGDANAQIGAFARQVRERADELAESLLTEQGT